MTSFVEQELNRRSGITADEAERILLNIPGKNESDKEEFLHGFDPIHGAKLVDALANRFAGKNTNTLDEGVLESANTILNGALVAAKEKYGDTAPEVQSLKGAHFEANRAISRIQAERDDFAISGGYW